ncbi:hypothetical protein CFC21_007744 [Triticum aestivum]|uniref:F-box protein At3g26010-like beta-propeller domain-containing protein n=2 Tax=Triticum aestivum TaxID=4565 RepID=A0A9R1IRQ0_WHEAT|nr:hypothetical protein CFC21_007744 [Triticum aestivum]
MLRRVAGAAAAPLRRCLCMAASRPPWALTYRMAALGASGAPSPAARASLDLHQPPCVSQLSVPTHLADGMDLAAATIQAASCDGLLLLDFADTGDWPEAIRDCGGSSKAMPGLAACAAAVDPGVRRFVCNPLSGQLFRLPVPSMDAALTTTPFGLLTQSDDPHGPPDRFVVAQLCLRERDGQRVVRRFRSETGEWDEPPLFVPSAAPAWRPMPNHEVVAFGDRLWWVDPFFGVFSVDPFSDRPEHGFVALPRSLPNFDMDAPLMLFRLLGVSEGKLRYVELTTKEPFMLYSFSLDDEGSSWKLTHEKRLNLVLSDKSIPRECEMPWISAIDPFNANIFYFTHGDLVCELDIDKGETGSSSFPDSITSRSYSSAFFVPVMLPTWLESYNLPCAGTLSRKATNGTWKTLADMLIPCNGPTTELMVVLEDMNSHFGEMLGQSWRVPLADALPEPWSIRSAI